MPLCTFFSTIRQHWWLGPCALPVVNACEHVLFWCPAFLLQIKSLVSQLSRESLLAAMVSTLVLQDGTSGLAKAGRSRWLLFYWQICSGWIFNLPDLLYIYIFDVKKPLAYCLNLFLRGSQEACKEMENELANGQEHSSLTHFIVHSCAPRKPIYTRKCTRKPTSKRAPENAHHRPPSGCSSCPKTDAVC